MINYIKKMKDNTLYISEDFNVLKKDCTFQKYINALLAKQLTTITSRERSTKNKLKFSMKIPIFVDKQTLLMCIKSYRLEDSFYINYFAITSYRVIQNDVCITLMNKQTIKIYQKYTFYNQLEKCRKILDFIE